MNWLSFDTDTDRFHPALVQIQQCIREKSIDHRYDGHFHYFLGCVCGREELDATVRTTLFSLPIPQCSFPIN